MMRVSLDAGNNEESEKNGRGKEKWVEWRVEGRQKMQKNASTTAIRMQVRWRTYLHLDSSSKLLVNMSNKLSI